MFLKTKPDFNVIYKESRKRGLKPNFLHAQFSIRRPGTRLNSLVLLVTKIASRGRISSGDKNSSSACLFRSDLLLATPYASSAAATVEIAISPVRLVRK